MQLNKVQEMIALTQECLSRYWQLDPAVVLNYCAEDVVWIGAVQSQFMQGREAVAADFQNIMQELKPCHLLEQEFFAAQNTGKACTVVGRYLVTTDESVEYFLQAQQRATFVWEQTEQGPKIKQIHVSNPMGELKVLEDKLFVNEIGQAAKRYLDSHLRRLTDKGKIIVRDMKDTTYFLSPMEVLYAQASRRYCEVHTNNGSVINARMSIADFSAQAGDRFLAVHRSYVVNADYITQIRPNEVALVNEAVIPIPEKKYQEIREQLLLLCGEK